jgi:hypothetical protein
MARSTTHYSTFLTSWCALVGIPTSRLSTEVAASANALFNSALQTMWIAGPWLETSPRGEARFAGNKLSYPNNLAITSAWTATNLTITGNSIQNPVDGRITASKLLETVTNGAHSVLHGTNAIVVSTSYQVSAYVRPNARSWVYLKYADGDVDHTAFFNVTTGALGTATNCVSSMSAQSNGYYLCQLTFTTSTSITPTGALTIQVSTDGSTLSYAGDTAKGLYVWGVLLQQTSNTSMNDYLVEWDQSGEDVIDAVFDVYQTSPFATSFQRSQTYTPTPYGIQLINGTWTNYYVNGVNQNNIYGSNPANPVFLFYRRKMPNFTGETYSSTETYAVDEQVYFVNSAGDGDFYKCLVATTAGQSPATTPTSWEIIPLYQVFFQYCVYKTFADWLVSDGQMDKAAGFYAVAKNKMDDEFDVLERQMGTVMPVKMQTHLSTMAVV